MDAARTAACREAWDFNEIRVRAIVRGSARSDARAREIANQVQMQAGGGRVYATGRISTARVVVGQPIVTCRAERSRLPSASNGGITIIGVTGSFLTTGGVKLQDVGGA